MTGRIFDRVLVPVANQEDTEATCEAIEPYLGEMEEVLLAHVVEQTSGYMDHTSPEALEEDARAFLELARQRLGGEAIDEVHLRFGSDVIEEIVALVDEQDITSVVFLPRDKGMLWRLVDGTDTGTLTRECPVPVVALP